MHPQPKSDAGFITTTIPQAATLPRVTTDLTEDQNRALRALFKEAMESRFKGRVTDLARTLKRTQPAISDFINGRTGTSFETARRFAEDVDHRARAILKISGAGPQTAAPTRSARERGLEMARLARLPQEAIDRVAKHTENEPDYADLDEDGWYQTCRIQARLYIEAKAKELKKRPKRKPGKQKQREPMIEEAIPSARRASGTE